MLPSAGRKGLPLPQYPEVFPLMYASPRDSRRNFHERVELPPSTRVEEENVAKRETTWQEGFSSSRMTPLLCGW
jgi:hypothetical protein